jgi:hypothetical protein
VENEEPSLILRPQKCPFSYQSAKYTLAFGPDACRNRILALFEFWATDRQTEYGVVLIEASYTWICEGLFFEFTRPEVAAAMEYLQEAGLITRPDRGYQVIRRKSGEELKRRKSTGGRTVWTVHVDKINKRISDAIVGTKEFAFDDWTLLMRKKFLDYYHKAANHPGSFNQCGTCAGWIETDNADRSSNHGMEHTGSPDNHGMEHTGYEESNHGTGNTGTSAPRTLVESETSADGALHKRICNNEGVGNPKNFSSFLVEDEQNQAPTKTDASGQPAASLTPTLPPGSAAPPPAAPSLGQDIGQSRQSGKECQGSAAAQLDEDRKVQEILDAFSDQLSRPLHEKMIRDRLKDEEFRKHCIPVLDDAYRIVNDRIGTKPVIWALKRPDNWVKVFNGDMASSMTGAPRVPHAPITSLAQGAPRPEPTAKDLYIRRITRLENEADTLGLMKQPKFAVEWRRIRQESIDTGWKQEGLDLLAKKIKEAKCQA